ncbi:putative F-box family protein [Melia azedarach]|uniref:F-box family protein n=1 Tax=Melia azedarach TaxID=155640 RepID=A0ACC1YMK3_MELAZ|nr:putative F-box family protein [Melia azedarach]
MASCSPTTSERDQGGSCMTTTILTLHPDIVETHILTRLDGQTLAAAACTSSQLHSLCTQENLWREICSSTWPSASDPRVQTIISDDHRSFFSDSFPVLDCRQKPPSKHTRDVIITKELISSVDIYYQNKAIFSKVAETETVTGWFQFPPFRIDLLDLKDRLPTPIQFVGETDVLFKHLEENLTLSWIIVEPDRRRAVNLSSRWPVSVEEDWLTHELHVKYAVVMAGDQRWGLFSGRGLVECEVMVILGGQEVGGEMYVKEVTMQMKDMEGKNLCGKDSLVILKEVMENGKGKRGRKGEEKEGYEEFLQKKRERKDKKERIENVLNNVCLATGFLLFVAFLSIKFFF